MQDYLNEYLQKQALKHQDNREKSHGTRFTASDAGLCVAKSWHRREGTEQTLPNNQALLMMKLGDAIHGIIQNAIWVEDPEAAYIEFFLAHKDLNLCGSLDLYMKKDKHLVDIKTVHTYKFSKMFGRYKDTKPAEHHEMQLGTYGMMLNKHNIPVEKISILYVNRNDGRMKEKDVSLDFIEYAKSYWETINLEMEYGPDGFEEHFMLPVYDWECRYCGFADNCKWKKEDK